MFDIHCLDGVSTDRVTKYIWKECIEGTITSLYLSPKRHKDETYIFNLLSYDLEEVLCYNFTGIEPRDVTKYYSAPKLRVIHVPLRIEQLDEIRAKFPSLSTITFRSCDITPEMHELLHTQYTDVRLV